VDTLDFDSGAFPGYQHQTTLKDAKHLDVASDKAAKACKVRVTLRLGGGVDSVANSLFNGLFGVDTGLPANKGACAIA
jgi:hypothetical protein